MYRRQVALADDGSGFTVSFRDRDAIVTPYVAVSEADEEDSASRLPIRRVVIGQWCKEGRDIRRLQGSDECRLRVGD